MSIKTFVMVAMLLLMSACSKEEGYTKDVSFLFPIKCNELQISDSFAGEVVNTIHMSDVDTAVVKFHMKYGTHNIVAVIDGNTVSRDFTVSDSTPLTISIVADDKWDGSIIYNGQ